MLQEASEPKCDKEGSSRDRWREKQSLPKTANSREPTEPVETRPERRSARPLSFLSASCCRAYAPPETSRNIGRRRPLPLKPILQPYRNRVPRKRAPRSVRSTRTHIRGPSPPHDFTTYPQGIYENYGERKLNFKFKNLAVTRGKRTKRRCPEGDGETRCDIYNVLLTSQH